MFDEIKQHKYDICFLILYGNSNKQNREIRLLR